MAGYVVYAYDAERRCYLTSTFYADTPEDAVADAQDYYAVALDREPSEVQIKLEVAL